MQRNPSHEKILLEKPELLYLANTLEILFRIEQGSSKNACNYNLNPHFSTRKSSKVGRSHCPHEYLWLPNSAYANIQQDRRYHFRARLWNQKETSRSVNTNPVNYLRDPLLPRVLSCVRAGPLRDPRTKLGIPEYELKCPNKFFLVVGRCNN